MSGYSNSNNVNDVSMSSGCSYTSLGQYTSKAMGGVSMPQANFMLVPNYGGNSYYSLQNGAPKVVGPVDLGSTCGNQGYMGMQKAYGACPTSFTSLAGVNCRR